MNIKGQMVEPPSFLYMFKLATVNAENDLGSWFKYKLEEVGTVLKKEIFAQAEALSDSVSEGKVKASEPVDTDSSSSKETNTKTPF